LSIRHIDAVLGHAQYSGGELLVLIVLANYADECGVCWPSVKRIAATARLGERRVHAILRRLRSDGAISVVSGAGKHQVNRYQLHLQSLTLNCNSVNPSSLNPNSLKPNSQTLNSSSPQTVKNRQ
jgi:hypothetical protein